MLTLLVIVIGIGKFTVFSIGQATTPAKIFSPDSQDYINTALALLKTGRFAVNPEHPDTPQVKRTPGYPLFIAGIFYLFGERYSLLIFAQILINLGTIICTYTIATMLWNRKIALGSALLLALDLPSFVNSQQILSDTLFTFGMSLTIMIGIYGLKKTSPHVFLMFLHGTLLAFTTLIRPLLYYAIFPVSLTYVFILRTHFAGKWKKVASLMLMLLIPWVVLIGGWQVRNYVVAGSAEFSNIVGWNLLFCRGAAIIAQRDGISYAEARQRLGFDQYTALPPEANGRTIAQLDRKWKREGLRIIFRHPGLYLKSQVRGAFTMMLGTGWREFLRSFAGEQWEQKLSGGPGNDVFTLSFHAYLQKWIIGNPGFFAFFLFAEMYLLVVYLSTLYAIIWLIVNRKNNTNKEAHLFILMFLIYLFMVSVSAGPEAYFRFRIPMIPLLSLYAGSGLFQISSLLQGYLRRMREH